MKSYSKEIKALSAKIEKLDNEICRWEAKLSITELANCEDPVFIKLCKEFDKAWKYRQILLKAC